MASLKVGKPRAHRRAAARKGAAGRARMILKKKSKTTVHSNLPKQVTISSKILTK
jgi:hypothetical protein